MRARHLQEHRLFDCDLAERHGESVDPRDAEHLADCEACAARYATLTDFMDEVRTHSVADADAVFTPEHLRAQQHQIARRIEHIGRHARVISFPKSGAGDRTTTHAAFVATHRRPRWVAAAVAAGLFVGVTLGASFEWERRAWLARSVAAGAAQTPSIRVPAGPTRSAVPGVEAVAAAPDLVPELRDASDSNLPSDMTADDAFLSELEASLERPRTRALQPFDDLTPHVREIRAIR